MRRTITRIAVAAGSALVALSAITAPARASVPVTRVQAGDSGYGWSGMTVRPGGFYFGAGGSPFLRHLSWQAWHNGSAAYATGTLGEQVPGCTSPGYLCPYAFEPATLYLYSVKTHGSLHYFSALTIRFTYQGQRYRDTASFIPRCASCGPSWVSAQLG